MGSNGTPVLSILYQVRNILIQWTRAAHRYLRSKPSPAPPPGTIDPQLMDSNDHYTPGITLGVQSSVFLPVALNNNPSAPSPPVDESLTKIRRSKATARGGRSHKRGSKSTSNRKKKGDDDAESEDEGMPVKRGRPKKHAQPTVEDVVDEDDRAVATGTDIAAQYNNTPTPAIGSIPPGSNPQNPLSIDNDVANASKNAEVVPAHLLPINNNLLTDYMRGLLLYELSVLAENQGIIKLGNICRKSLPKTHWKAQALLTATEVEHAYQRVYACYFNIVDAAERENDEVLYHECFRRAEETKLGFNEVNEWRKWVEEGNWD